MDVIGKKSKQAVTSAFFGGIFALVIGIGFIVILFTVFEPAEDKFIYFVCIVPGIFILAGLYSIFNGFRILKYPSDLVSIDDYCITLAWPKNEIKIDDIEAVMGENAIFTNHHTNGGYSYSTTNVARYGKIIIRTKDGGRYAQNYVDRVQEVAQILNNRILKKSSSFSGRPT